MQLVQTQGYATGVGAAVVVYGVHVAAPAVYGAVTFLQSLVASRRARLADARSVEEGPLQPGDAVVCGVVELAAGHDTAVRVEIDQIGHERRSKQQWHHSWKETERRVRAHPFYLREARGVRVRVEPNEEATLVDGLDGVERKSRHRRTRYAELTPGEEIHAVGELVPVPAEGGAYRGAGEAFVLRPPLRGRMLLSSEWLGSRFRRHATHARYATVACVVHLVAFGFLDLGYHARVLEGRSEVGVVETATARTGKNRKCEITARLPRGQLIEEAVSYEWCATLAPGARVPVVTVPGSPGFEHLGQTAGISSAALFLGVIAFAAIVVFHRGRERPWYERPLVEHGVGRLE